MKTGPLSTLASQTGIPVWILEVARGSVPQVHDVTTATEGFELIKARFMPEGEKILILYQVISLITTLKEAKLLALACMRSRDLKLIGRVHGRWHELGRDCLANATTFEDIATLLPQLPPNSTVRRQALDKITKVMQTFAQAKFVLYQSRDNHALYHIALEAMIHFADTLEEAQDAYKSSELGDRLQILAWKKWNEIGRCMLLKTQSLSDIRVIVKLLPSGGEAIEFAARRALVFAGK
jgi:hypothetical protein